LLIPPFSSVGTSAASIGTGFLPLASTETSTSNMSRSIIPSSVFVARIGLSEFGGVPTAMRNVSGIVHE
jgi:hypothetical protein